MLITHLEGTMKTHRMIPLLAALLAVCVTTIGVQAQSSKKGTKASTAPAHPATLAATETATATPLVRPTS